jgi:hypothetical protein
MMMMTMLSIRNGHEFRIAGKRKLAEVKSPKQSTENKDKASSTASHSQTEQTNNPPPIIITGGENHKDLTSIIKQAMNIII